MTLSPSEVKRRLSEAGAIVQSANKAYQARVEDYLRTRAEIQARCPHEHLSGDASTYAHAIYCSDCGALVESTSEL